MSDFYIYIAAALFVFVPIVLKMGVRLPGVGVRFYPAYGLTLLLLFSAAEYLGWGYLDSDKIKGVPKTVRQNPGVYRSHYRSYGRTYGGK